MSPDATPSTRFKRCRGALPQSAVLFLIVGAVNTAFGFVVFRVALAALGARPGAPALAQGLAYVLGTAVGYAAHRRLTFRSVGSAARELPRFVAVNAVLLLSTAALMQWLVARLGAPPAPTWVCVMTVATLASYQLQRRAVFVRSRA